jgi:Ni,Fe-hydrogenase III small subunit
VFEGSEAVIGAVDNFTPVDRHIPGCPPKPQALLAGLTGLMPRAAP